MFEIKFELKYRNFGDLTEECLEILTEYQTGSINQIECHNKLLGYGFYLKEDNTVVDY